MSSSAPTAGGNQTITSQLLPPGGEEGGGGGGGGGEGEGGGSDKLTPEALGLTAEELEAFQADKFTFGSIPEHAPPPTLCH